MLLQTIEFFLKMQGFERTVRVPQELWMSTLVRILYTKFITTHENQAIHEIQVILSEKVLLFINRLAVDIGM